MQNCIGQLDRARSAVTCHTNDVIQDVTEKYWMSLLVKNMQSHVPRAIWSFSASSAPMRSFKLVTEAKHCIRQSVLQAGPNAILYSYYSSNAD